MNVTTAEDMELPNDREVGETKFKLDRLRKMISGQS